MLWARGNDWDREWIQQVVALLVGHGAFTLYPGCPIHQWLNSIGAQVIVEKWQSPEQWPNLYWLPLPEVDGHTQGGLVLLPAHLLPISNTLQRHTPANAFI